MAASTYTTVPGAGHPYGSIYLHHCTGRWTSIWQYLPTPLYREMDIHMAASTYTTVPGAGHPYGSIYLHHCTGCWTSIWQHLPTPLYRVLDIHKADDPTWPHQLAETRIPTLSKMLYLISLSVQQQLQH